MSTNITTTTRHFEINPNLFLVEHSISIAAEKAAPEPVHHVLVIDCSGSMSGELPKIRASLKSKLVEIVSENDLVSIVWFSGRGEAGTLIEKAGVPTLREMKKLHDAIDRWLKPVGLTGFVEPLDIVKKLVKGGGDSGRYIQSLFFMSDGMDNQWQRDEIVKAVEGLKGLIDEAAFVEYGYYADRQLLSKMAATLGGTLVFAEDFKAFDPAVVRELKKSSERAPRVVVGLGDSNAIEDFVFAIDVEKQTIAMYAADRFKGQASVPASAGSVYWLSNAPPSSSKVMKAALGTERREALKASLYAAMSLMAMRARPDMVRPVIGALGDVDFAAHYGGMFGKQKLSEFMLAAERAVFDDDMRGEIDFERAVPNENLKTVLDVLAILSDDEETRILLDDHRFRYTKISLGREDATDDDVPKLKFEVGPSPDGRQGYAIQDFTWNKDRANVSVLVKKYGAVDLTGRLPAGASSSAVPLKFPTHIFRNYPLVRDGLVNVDSLVVAVSPATERALEAIMPSMSTRVDRGISTPDLRVLILDLGALPIMNIRESETRYNAAATVLEQVEIVKKQARAKVLKHVFDARSPDARVLSGSYATLYGDDAALWLKDQGLDAFNGYAPPKTKQVEAKDFYLAKVIEVSLKGLNSLPSVNEVLKKRADKKKQTVSGALMLAVIEDLERKEKATGSSKLYGDWLKIARDQAVLDVRIALRQMARKKFTMIVGQTWFYDAPDAFAYKTEVDVEGYKVEASIDAVEVRQEI